MKLDLFYSIYCFFSLCNYPRLLFYLTFHYAEFIILYPPIVAGNGDNNFTWEDSNHDGILITSNDNINLCTDDNLNSNCAQNETQETGSNNSNTDPRTEESSSGGGMQSAVEFGIHLSFKECQHRFTWSRWNCSEKDWLANTGTKENAYVTATTAAAVTYSIAKGCARGDIQFCGCAPPMTISSGGGGGGNDASSGILSSSHLHQGGYWRWGGCSADVDFAIKLARRSKHKTTTPKKSYPSNNAIEKDVLHAVMTHNRRVGRNIVQKSLDTDCKCHGVSGSCTLKTCWMKLPQFGKIGRMVFNLYKKSSLVVPDNSDLRHMTSRKRSNSTPTSKRRVHLEISEHGGQPLITELVHLISPPTYCDHEESHPGTKGRRCLRSSVESTNENLGEGSCSILCCGRGYNTHVTTRRWKCNCVFHWCCVVECQDCQEKVQIYTCN